MITGPRPSPMVARQLFGTRPSDLAKSRRKTVRLMFGAYFAICVVFWTFSNYGPDIIALFEGGSGSSAPGLITDPSIKAAPRKITPSSPKEHEHAASTRFVKLATQKNPDHFVLTFVGDTMLANTVHSWEVEHDASRKHNMAAAFDNLRPLLQKSDFIVMNLEGPISDLPLDAHPLKRKYSFSFGMNPNVSKVLKELGVGACNGANNHAVDRGIQGMNETRTYLEQVGIPYFGCGLTREEKADPLVIELPHNGKRLSISSFLEGDQVSDMVFVGEGRKPINVTIRPEPRDIAAALQAIDRRGGADIKIAFPHWIRNYLKYVRNHTIASAHAMVEKGGRFDVIVGSAGSHTVHRFDYIGERRVPCLYDIGNFAFMNPEAKQPREGGELSYFGSVTHLILSNDGTPLEFEIHCTLHNQKKVFYKPRPCTPVEAKQLFETLGPHVQHKDGDIIGKVILIK